MALDNTTIPYWKELQGFSCSINRTRASEQKARNQRREAVQAPMKELEPRAEAPMRFTAVN